MRSTTPTFARLSLATLLAGGCAGGPSGPAPDALAYGEPDPNPATFTFTDSTFVAVEAPGYGVMELTSGRTGTAELRFHDAPDGFAVQVRFVELEGGVGSAVQGESRVDEDDVGGVVGVELSFTGDIAVVDTPAATAALADLSGLDGLLRPLFVSLPGRQVGVGATWVDTVRTREEVAGTVWRGRRVVTSTLVGDTLVEGRRLLRVRVAADTEVDVDGVSGGVEIEQRLAGTLYGWFLWDDRAHLLVERTEAGELTGTLEMPGTGVGPLPMTATVRRTVRLGR